MDFSISPNDFAKWIPLFSGLPIWWQLAIVIALTAVVSVYIGWVWARRADAREIRAKDATIEILKTKIEVSSLAIETPPESWPRLDAIRRRQIANTLRVLTRSENRLYDVSIQSLFQSDCHDLAVDLRDAIQEAGLRTLLIDNVMRRASDSGIRIEGNRTDPIFQKLIKALDQVGLPCKVKNEDGYHLALRIGRRS